MAGKISEKTYTCQALFLRRRELPGEGGVWHGERRGDCTTVRLYDCTTVRLYDCTTVRLYDCTTVRLYDCTTVRLYDCKIEQIKVREVSLFVKSQSRKVAKSQSLLKYAS